MEPKPFIPRRSDYYQSILDNMVNLNNIFIDGKENTEQV